MALASFSNRAIEDLTVAIFFDALASDGEEDLLLSLFGFERLVPIALFRMAAMASASSTSPVIISFVRDFLYFRREMMLRCMRDSASSFSAIVKRPAKSRWDEGTDASA